eukprot:TRINITY_DN9115_c0_g1_i2.p1 TRINITY_DN9115_c0_g1~~TRINITY_DN9115_c0_g1_i2.p1  ORF type:complete len:228 (-),score=59.75 TRINITY_DN9115_c0_g1_i2:12-695(-)
MEADGLLEDMKFDEELEGFFNGTGGTVNLSAQPMSIGHAEVDAGPAPSSTNSKAAGGASQASQAGMFAAALAGASSMFGGRLGMAQAVLGGLLSSAAQRSDGPPSTVGAVKDQATSFLSKAQPWREFVWPLSIPSANQGCSRITANIYNFQTNYAILFVVQLVCSIIMQPSALICIITTVVVWVLFLKKNDDPEWTPKLGGVVLSPMQRWLLLAVITGLVLLMQVGG